MARCLIFIQTMKAIEKNDITADRLPRVEID